jgi:Tfp pilus assembly protein PilO
MSRMLKIGRENLIMVSVLAAFVLGGLLIGYLPSARKLDRIAQENVTIRTALEVDGEQAAGVPGLMRQVEEMKSKYKDFDRRLPRRQELGGFLREISENLAEENLTNQTIEPGKPLQEDLFFTLPIVMKFRGTYMSLARFLERIDGFERLTRIGRLAIAPGPSGGLLDITVQMNIYFTES